MASTLNFATKSRKIKNTVHSHTQPAILRQEEKLERWKRQQVERIEKWKKKVETPNKEDFRKKVILNHAMTTPLKEVTNTLDISRLSIGEETFQQDEDVCSKRDSMCSLASVMQDTEQKLLNILVRFLSLINRIMGLKKT
jgi:long-subunit acyl-CoA synthetase (AMP-forming)